MAARISKKTGEFIPEKLYQHRPSFSEVRKLAKKKLLFQDSKGRLYGQYRGYWFVNLPTTPAHAAVDEEVEFPAEGLTISATHMKTGEEKVFKIESYPEKMTEKTGVFIIQQQQ